jgi:hypothetical protein
MLTVIPAIAISSELWSAKQYNWNNCGCPFFRFPPIAIPSEIKLKPVLIPDGCSDISDIPPIRNMSRNGQYSGRRTLMLEAPC